MTPKAKKVLAAVLLIVGGVVIAWNARSGSGIERGFPNTARRDFAPKIAALPAPVQATIHRESEGGAIKDINKKGDAADQRYEVEIIKGNTKTTIEIASDGAVRKRKERSLKPTTTSRAGDGQRLGHERQLKRASFDELVGAYHLS